ncbi:histidine kinase [Nonomuraea sp. ZG12]|uniref:sensor histidine kinase n=1 Tax=Nonomuraea sp. ZG12 TaxID=3452207 RepID=UPI003F8CB9F0
MPWSDAGGGVSQVPVPRLARAIVVVVLAGLTSVYLLAGSLLAIVAFGLQLVYVLRSLRRFRRPWLLILQALVGYTATLGFGASVGLLGFLGGSLLLTPAWPLAPLVAVSAAVVGPADPAISMVLVALVVYGLTRLTDRVEEMHAARLAMALAAAAEERLRIATGLSDGLGRGLTAIATGVRSVMDRPEGSVEILGEVVGTARGFLADARNAAAGYRATSLVPEMTTARAMLTAAAIKAETRVGHSEPLGPAGALLASVLREVVTEAVRQNTARTCVIETTTADGMVRLRVSHDGARTAEDEGLADLARQLSQAGGRLTTGLSAEGWLTVDAALPERPAEATEDPGAYRLSVALLTAVLVGFSIKALLFVPANLVVPAAACLAVIVIMQIRWISGRHMGALALLVLLAYLPIPVFGRAWLGSVGFLAGPVLLAFPWAVAWPLVGCVMASVAVSAVLLGLPLPLTVNFTASTLVTGLVVYGLLELARLVKELQEVRQALARSAVVEERLRAARDLHDLLGHSMAAILLKCELARRLDPARARAELEDVLVMAEKAEADLRVVSGGQPAMSLAAEGESARSVLAAAGIEVELDFAHEELSPEVENVLGTVLREAVTNVLRHSSARYCLITTVVEESVVRLRVRNDGVRSSGGRPGSAGIGNLTTRLAVLDGGLGTVREDGWFELTAQVPSFSPVG